VYEKKARRLGCLGEVEEAAHRRAICYVEKFIKFLVFEPIFLFFLDVFIEENYS
jgi:hypothetical protein